jgi:dephospho-CoA kinase
MAYLITGRAGSGKSTVCLALKQHGYEAYDADAVPGLAHWIDRQTGKVTAVDYTKYVDYSQVGWDWDETVLAKFLGAHPGAFLCGSASNQLEFYASFKRVFVLELDPATHRHRLQTRASTYAKDPRQIEEIIQEQQELVKQSISLGAHVVDTSQALPEEIVKMIADKL